MSWDGPTLLDSFERDGEWWLPGDLSENRVFGRASFDPAGGVHLKTFRPLREERGLQPGAGFRPPLILGFWGHGTPVTLHQATRVGPAHFPESDQGSDFYARYAIDGHHFHDAEDVSFVSLRAGFTELEQWAKHHPFVDAIPIPGEQRTGYFPMRPVEATVNALGARLTVRSDMASWGLVPMRTLRWEHRVVFEVEPEEKRPLPWYREVLGGLQDFLTLMVGRPVYPSTVEAQALQGGNARPDVFFDGGLRSPEDRGVTPVAALSRGSDVFLPLPEVRLELPEALESWFAKREKLAPVHGLFFGALFGPKTGPEFQFLSLAQALETYHRRTRSASRYESEEEYQGHYEKIVDALPGTLPGPLRQRLKQTLKYGNEWSLRKRVKDLLDEIPEEGVLESERERFVQRVVDTRNYLTHYSEDSEAGALRGPKLNETVDELRRVLAFFLLRELGLNEQKIFAAVAKVPRYGYFSLED